MTPIRLLIVDDHALFRRGLVALLQNEPQFQISGQAANGEQALRLIEEGQVDVVLMDVQMPAESGVEVARRLLAAQPGLRIIMLTVSAEDKDILAAIEAGARGYLLKSADADELVRAICYVHAGEAILAPAVTLSVLEAMRGATAARPGDARLTPREREVLQLLEQGAANREIALALSISESTVKTHVAHILEKLKVQSRSQLVASARGPAWRSPRPA